MAKVKIIDIRDRPKFVGPGKREVYKEYLYKTAKGYLGSVTLPKTGLTEEKIQKAIREDMEIDEKILGEEITV